MQNEQLADAADRLILDEAAAVLSAEGETGAGGLAGADLVVIGSAALADGALAAGARSAELHLDTSGKTRDLDASLVANAHVVLLRLPKSLEELDHIARLISSHAAPDVVLFAGARLKYMTVGMNDVLAKSFDRLDVSHARQKSRVLTARGPRAIEQPTARREFQSDLGLWVGAVGGVFAGTGLDIGTRAMLDAFGRLPGYETAIDLGCGTGILAAELKRRRPNARVIASDTSAIAVASAIQTMAANELDVEVVRDAGLASQADASVDLIVLNPPFHDGGAVTTDIALRLFEDAARVLRPGGQLWTVWNSHLAYKPALTRAVGPTLEVSRTPKFTVTASTRQF
jgi:16S rRNA (guanine1207-N2)-methyltransferase